MYLLQRCKFVYDPDEKAFEENRNFLTLKQEPVFLDPRKIIRAEGENMYDEPDTNPSRLYKNVAPSPPVGRSGAGKNPFKALGQVQAYPKSAKRKLISPADSLLSSEIR